MDLRKFDLCDDQDNLFGLLFEHLEVDDVLKEIDDHHLSFEVQGNEMILDIGCQGIDCSDCPYYHQNELSKEIVDYIFSRIVVKDDNQKTKI